MTDQKKKALDVGAAKQTHNKGNRDPFPFQEEGVTMSTSLPPNAVEFEARIKTAGFTVQPGLMTGGTEPGSTVVVLSRRGLRISLTTAEAFALSSALGAVALHILESEQTEAVAA